MLLAIGLALGSIAAGPGCLADEAADDPPTPQTGVAEQASRVQWCDTQYLDSLGHQIGQCILPCNGRQQCIGITSGPAVAGIEHSCQPCRDGIELP